MIFLVSSLFANRKLTTKTFVCIKLPGVLADKVGFLFPSVLLKLDICKLENLLHLLHLGPGKTSLVQLICPPIRDLQRDTHFTGHQLPPSDR